MSQSPAGSNWFIDIRNVPSPENISLDLTRHLPRRAAVGPVVIITDRPAVLLSVVRKRWSVLIREVQRQYSSTLQAAKKEGLKRELQRLNAYTFAKNGPGAQNANILFATWSDLPADRSFDTIYLTVPLAHQQLFAVIGHLQAGGFLVTYTGWPDSAPQTQ